MAAIRLLLWVDAIVVLAAHRQQDLVVAISIGRDKTRLSSRSDQCEHDGHYA